MLIETIKNIVAIAFGVAMSINALLFVPQIIKLWHTKEAKDLSLITFAGFNVIQALGVLHGYLNHDFSLALGFFLSALTCGTITIQILYYKILSRGKVQKNV